MHMPAQEHLFELPNPWRRCWRSYLDYNLSYYDWKGIMMQLPESIDVPVLDLLTKFEEWGRIITKPLLFFFGECKIVPVFCKLSLIIRKYPCRRTDVVGQLSRGLLQLREHLDSRRAVANHRDFLACHINRRVPGPLSLDQQHIPTRRQRDTPICSMNKLPFEIMKTLDIRPIPVTSKVSLMEPQWLLCYTSKSLTRQSICYIRLLFLHHLVKSWDATYSKARPRSLGLLSIEVGHVQLDHTYLMFSLYRTRSQNLKHRM